MTTLQKPGISPALTEAYPHPALPTILDLDRSARDEASKTGKHCGREYLVLLRHLLLNHLQFTLDALNRAIDRINFSIPMSFEPGMTIDRLKRTKAFDALICTWDETHYF